MTKRQIPKSAVLQEIQSLYRELDGVRKRERFSKEYKLWHRKVRSLIEKAFDDKQVSRFNSIRYSPAMYSSGTPEHVFDERFQEGLDTAEAHLKSLQHEVETYWDIEDQST